VKARPKLLLNLNTKRYGGHDFWAELLSPKDDGDAHEHIKAGNVYYWDGWTPFNYVDWDISPYQVVQIGEISGISQALQIAPEPLQISLEK